MTGRLVAVNAGTVRVHDGFSAPSAIDKRPKRGSVAVTPDGLLGDAQGDRTVHGGKDQAVYAYAREDLRYWEDLLGRTLTFGKFGENLTTCDIDVAGAVVGEIWRVGTTCLQVSAPRIPCPNFQQWMGEAQWVRRFARAGRPGAYLRVLRGGSVKAGDVITIEGRPTHGVTVADVINALMFDRSSCARVLQAPELSRRARHLAALRASTVPCGA